MEIIPAIDIIDGKCVRLTQGDYSQKKIYNENPLEVAREFEDAGLMRLHLVDLDGAKAGAVKNWKVLKPSRGKLHWSLISEEASKQKRMFRLFLVQARGWRL